MKSAKRTWNVFSGNTEEKIVLLSRLIRKLMTFSFF